jgi:hypothetical protein
VGKVAAPSLVGGWSYCAGYQNILFELNLFSTYQAGIEVYFKYGMQIDVLD